MMNYANRFYCFINSNKTEFVLTFAQDQPVVDDNGNISNASAENVASVVMTADLAKTLKEHLENLLSDGTI